MASRTLLAAFVDRPVAALRGLVGRFWRDRRGNYSMMVVLLLPVLTGFVGVGTEAGLWLYDQQTQQAATDAAAFSAATYYATQEPQTGGTAPTATELSNAETQAFAIAANYGFTSAGCQSGSTTCTPTCTGSGTSSSCNFPASCSLTNPGTGSFCIQVNFWPKSGPFSPGSNTSSIDAFEVKVAQSPQQLFSRALMGNNPVVIQARSVGTVQATTTTGSTTTTGTACVLALGSANAVSTVVVTGTASVALTNCNLAVDSTASGSSGDALTVTSGGSVSANVTLASTSSAIGGTVTGTVTAGVTTANPYTLPITTTVNCSSSTESVTARNLAAGKTTTLSPGVYDQDIAIDGATVTLTAGVYFICPGTGTTANSFSVSSGTVTGTGVTIVLLGTGTLCSTVDISGGTVNLSAPTGTTSPAGFTGLVFANAASSSGNACTPPAPTSGSGNQVILSGGTSLTITGAIDLPGFHVTYSGGSGTSGCTQLIADSIVLSGTSSLASNCSGDGTTSIATSTTSTGSTKTFAAALGN